MMPIDVFREKESETVGGRVLHDEVDYLLEEKWKIDVKRWNITLTVTFLFSPPFFASPKPTILSLMLCRLYGRVMQFGQGLYLLAMI